MGLLVKNRLNETEIEVTSTTVKIFFLIKIISYSKYLSF